MQKKFQTEHQLSCKGGLKIEKYNLKKSDAEESSVSMHHEPRLKNVTELTDKENAFQESQRTVQKSVSSDLKNNKKGNRRRQENLMKTQVQVSILTTKKIHTGNILCTLPIFGNSNLLFILESACYPTYKTVV